ncbi:hypothetical protein [Nostoc sp.]
MAIAEFSSAIAVTNNTKTELSSYSVTRIKLPTLELISERELADILQ